MKTPTQTLTPSTQQALIYEHAADGTSIIIDSVAGSGKTHTLVECALQSPTRFGLCLSYNKSIQLEIESRLPSNFEARTLNSHGWKALNLALGKLPRLDTRKLANIAKDLHIPKAFADDAKELATAARNAGMILIHSALSRTPEKIDETLPRDNPETWAAIAESRNIAPSETLTDFARDILLESIHRFFRSTSPVMDFDDQIYIPTIYFPSKFTRTSCLLIDEAQDLTPLHHAIIAATLSPNAQLIAAGDPHQGIYGFRGAIAESMPLLASRFSLTHLPLSVSFRCPRNITREAQRIVPQMRFHPSAPPGSVIHHTTWTLQDIPPSSTIVCRNNAPLFKMFSRLIQSNIPCAMAGLDAVKRLITLIESFRLPKASTSHALRNRVAVWASRQNEKFPDQKPRTEDIAASIEAVASATETLTETLALLRTAFSRTNPRAILLSTIHRAKGLEWNEVWFLNPESIPSKYATTPTELAQESNLTYVAITRAKRTLHYISTQNLL